jgi:Fe-S cluster assembly iron-binding protein IscA
MLTITSDAATVLTGARESAGAPDSFGIRIFATVPPEGGDPQLAITFIPEAVPGDDVTEVDGLRAFIDPDLSEALSGVTLDAEQVEDGSSTLVLR